MTVRPTPQSLIDAIVGMREDDAMLIARAMLDAGTPPLEVLDHCRTALEAIGKGFEAGDFFIPELILAGEMLSQISAVVKPLLRGEATRERLGKVVIGTVEGDIHDIAKDIVVFMLEINGFEVIDLGVDVSTERFVDAMRESGAPVVGLSGFLTLAFDPMKHTVAALKAVDPNVHVMIGGGQIDERIREYTGADAYGKDAMAAVNLAQAWVQASPA